MITKMRWTLALFWLLLIGCDGGPECDAEGLASALEGASSGDVVRVGACRIEGTVFTVPAGVALEGEAGSVIAGRINLSSGRVSNLEVESSDAGIVARDGDDVIIEDVKVTASIGIGIAVNNVASAELSRIELRGPVTAGNISAIQGSPPDPLMTATHGLILENVPSATLSEISTHGFARFGALMKSSTTTWTNGDASDNAWVGVMVEQGRAALSDVAVNDILDLRLEHGSTFGVVTGTATLDTERLSVRGSEGFGLYHLNGWVTHEDLIANDNSYGGVRLEIVRSAQISGELSGNDFGAIVAYVSRNVVVRDTTISNSARVMRSESGDQVVEAGDGIQLVDSTEGALIQDTTIAGNDRAGMVIELFGRNLDAGLFDNVTVSRDNASENGVLVQNGTRSAGWDTGLMRDADTEQADEAVVDPVDTVGAVGPCFFPAP
jgi:hypothetical protein